MERDRNLEEILENQVREVIIHKEGRFISWSTREKRPQFYNRRRSDFLKELSVEYGPYSWFGVEARMRLAEQYGTSLGLTVEPEQVVKGNELGENQTELTLEEIFNQYVKEGLSPNLPVKFSSIALTPEASVRLSRWSEEKVVEWIEDYKKGMEQWGFKF